MPQSIKSLAESKAGEVAFAEHSHTFEALDASDTTACENDSHLLAEQQWARASSESSSESELEESHGAIEDEPEQHWACGSSENSSDSELEESGSSSDDEPEKVWEVDLGGCWKRFDVDVEDAIIAAIASGNQSVEYRARGQRYAIDIDAMHQVNIYTGARRAIRCSESSSRDALEPEIEIAPRSDRVKRLVENLLSPAVQVPLQRTIASEEAKLNPEEVRQVFIRHVPGVEHFLFRNIPGQFTLNFLISVYQNGLQAFHGTTVGAHLLSLYRCIVHHGHETESCGSLHLRDVAEAFLSCQAEQARVIQRVGLEIQGIQGNFRGLVERLAGEYKIMALKTLAAERISQGKAWADRNPTHYENRLFADLGDEIGLDRDLVELSRLDGHANSRYEVLEGEEKEAALVRCRELFDLQALLDAFVAEVNSFNDASLSDSLPRMFLDWVSDHMVQKHIVFDESTCSKVEVTKSLALVVMEAMFLGSLGAPAEEIYRGIPLHDLFVR
jgi:hypothetical protein